MARDPAGGNLRGCHKPRQMTSTTPYYRAGSNTVNALQTKVDYMAHHGCMCPPVFCSLTQDGDVHQEHTSEFARDPDLETWLGRGACRVGVGAEWTSI